VGRVTSGGGNVRTADRLVWDLDLLDAKQVLAGIFDGSPLHLALVRHDGTITATNEAWDRFCRENGGDLVAAGPETNYLEILAAAEAEGIVEAAAARAQIEAAFAGTVAEDLVYRCDSPGEERTFRTFAVPFPQLEAALVAHTNVTDERLAAQLHDELLLGLSEGARSHVAELETAAQELLDRPSLLRDPNVDELAGRIARCSHQLRRLLDQLLDLEPVVSGTHRSTTAHLAPLVEDVLADIPVEDRTLVARIPDDLQVQTDPSRLALALEQLVTNAVHHTPPGTNVVIHTEPVEDESNGRVLLLVDDDGPGIPRHERDRLRRPFERGLLDRRGGPGLGLPIVDQLMRLDGERLLISDRPGGGARFGLPVQRVDG
jgi:signal transduction histidine kinase